MKPSLRLFAAASKGSSATKHSAKTSLSRILSSQSTTPLALLLKRLHMSPLPVLSPNVKSVNIIMAERNDHFGARHFVKEHLARIRYHNPNVPITIQKVAKSPNGMNWRAELEVATNDSKEKTSINMQAKHSLSIMHDLLSSFGTEPPPPTFPEGYESEASVKKEEWSSVGLVKRAPSLRPQLDVWQKQTQARLRAAAAAPAPTPKKAAAKPTTDKKKTKAKVDLSAVGKAASAGAEARA